MNEEYETIQSGSAKAIHVALVGVWFAYLMLLDEMLHVLDRWDSCESISGAEWRYRFCQYVHKHVEWEIRDA